MFSLDSLTKHGMFQVGTWEYSSERKRQPYHCEPDGSPHTFVPSSLSIARAIPLLISYLFKTSVPDLGIRLPISWRRSHPPASATSPTTRIATTSCTHILSTEHPSFFIMSSSTIPQQPVSQAEHGYSLVCILSIPSNNSQQQPHQRPLLATVLALASDPELPDELRSVPFRDLSHEQLDAAHRYIVLTKWCHSPGFCEPEDLDEVDSQYLPLTAVLDLYGMPLVLEDLWDSHLFTQEIDCIMQVVAAIYDSPDYEFLDHRKLFVAVGKERFRLMLVFLKGMKTSSVTGERPGAGAVEVEKELRKVSLAQDPFAR
jgi:hypothetical protein